jgi:hypothetical protein
MALLVIGIGVGMFAGFGVAIAIRFFIEAVDVPLVAVVGVDR